MGDETGRKKSRLGSDVAAHLRSLHPKYDEEMSITISGNGIRNNLIGSFASFTVNFRNLPEGSVVAFILENDRDQKRTKLNYVMIDGGYKVFYTLFVVGSYHILFTVDDAIQLSIRVRGLENPLFVEELIRTNEIYMRIISHGWDAENEFVSGSPLELVNKYEDTMKAQTQKVLSNLIGNKRKTNKNGKDGKQSQRIIKYYESSEPLQRQAKGETSETTNGKNSIAKPPQIKNEPSELNASGVMDSKLDMFAMP